MTNLRRSSSSNKKTLNAETRLCVLHGPEPMLKTEHLRSLTEALSSRHGPLETLSFDGKTAGLADVLDELRSFGLLQQYKLVVVDDADRFVSNYRHALERYVQSPAPQATLVLRCDRWNRGKLDRGIEKIGCLIKCSAVSKTEAKSWLVRQGQQAYGLKVTAPIAGRLIERLGCDLGRIDRELSKLSLFAAPDGKINPRLIDQVIGKTSDEKAWAIQESFLSILAAATDRRAGGQAEPASPSGPVAGAIEKIHELVHLSGEADVFVGYCVADLVRKLWLATRMRGAGVPAAQAARRLRLWGGGQALFFRAVDRLDPSAAGWIFDRIIRNDVRAKTGQGSTVRHLECFCAALPPCVR